MAYNLNPLSNQFLTNSSIPSGNVASRASAITSPPQNQVSTPAKTTPTNNVASVSSPAPTNNSNNIGSIQQPTPPSPDYSALNKAYGDALGGIDKQITAFQSALPTTISDITNQTTQQEGKVNSALSGINSSYDEQATQNKNDTKSANDQQANDASEILQGLQARYGGTTGTGAFSSEIVSRTVLNNLNQNKQALTTVLNHIETGRQQAIKDANDQILAIDQNSATLIQQAKDQLAKDIAGLQASKGALSVDAGKTVAGLQAQYATIVNDVNARNTAFKQQLALDEQNFNQQIQLKKMDVTNAALNNTHLTTAQLLGAAANGTLTPAGVQYANTTLSNPNGNTPVPDGILQNNAGSGAPLFPTKQPTQTP